MIPWAVDDSDGVDEDKSVEIFVLANDSDVDISREGDNLTINQVSDVDHGTYEISPDAKTITFTPSPDWSGTEVFTYEVTDTHGGTDSADVSVVVSPVDDDPDAQNDIYTILEDAPETSFNVLLNDNDADLDYGDALQITTIVSGASHGSVSIDTVNNRIKYKPDANYNGSDSFTYQIKDNQDPAVYDTAVVNISITSVNDLPVVTSENSHTIVEDHSVGDSLIVEDVDTGDSPDPDSHTFTIDTDALHGSVVLDEDTGAYSYTPDLDYNGSDSFIVLVTDERGGTTTKTVAIAITSSE